MKQNNHKLYVSTLALFSLVGCSNAPHKVSGWDRPKSSYSEAQDGQQVTNAAAKAAEAHNYVEINFSQSSAVLSKSATQSLDAVLQQARQEGDINEIIVLSWADEEYPSKMRNKLSKQSSQLAEKRNDAIRKYFESTTNFDVDTYNMAERPNTLSKWFNTTDSRLKNSFMAAGLPTTGNERQYPSKASHAVILIQVD